MGSVGSITLIYLVVLFIRAANALFIYSLSIGYTITAYLQGIIQGVYSLTEGFSGFLGGLIYDRLGPSKTLTIASLLIVFAYSLSTTIYMTHIDPSELIFPQIIAGLSAALLVTSSIALIAEETYGVSTRRRLFGVGGLEISNLSGYVVGFLIAALIEIFAPFLMRGFIPSLILTLLALALSISLSTRVKEIRLLHERQAQRLLFYVEKRSLYLVPMWLGVSIILGVAFISVKILRDLLSGVESYKYIGSVESSHGLSLYMVLAVVLLSIGILFGSYLSSVFGKTRSLLVGLLATPVAMISLGYFINKTIGIGITFSVTSIKRILMTPEISVSLALMIIGASLALMIPPSLLALLADFTDASRIRGLSSGIYVTTLGIGIFVGNVVGGYIFTYYGLMNLTIILSIIFTPLGLATYFLVKRSFEGSRS